MHVRHTQPNDLDGHFFEASQKRWADIEPGTADARTNQNSHYMPSRDQFGEDRQNERDVAATLEHAREYAEIGHCLTDAGCTKVNLSRPHELAFHPPDVAVLRIA